MMNYFLDTDICVFALKGESFAIKKSLQDLDPDQVKISSIVQAELLFGAFKSVNSKKAIHLVEHFLSPYEVISFGTQQAIVYAKVRCDLQKKGAVIGPNDLLIAATVLTLQGTLVTHNTKEFNRVPGLLLEDWTK